MKIVIATPIYLPEVGGPPIYIKELVARLKDTHELVIVALSDTGEEFPGSRLVRVRKSQAIPKRLWQFYQAVQREAADADVVYIQNAVAAGLPATLSARRLQVPTILKFVGDEAWERAYADGRTTKLLVDFLKQPEGGFKTWLFRTIQKFVLQRVNIVTTPSQYLGKAIVDSYQLDPERLIINYNASPLPIPKTEVERDPFLLNYVGRLVPHKNLHELIPVIVKLKAEFPELKLTIAGDGPEAARLQQLIEEHNASDYISLPGRIGRDEVAALMHQSVAHILNSSYEGLPHTALEAMSAGTALITTDIPGTNEVAIAHQTALTHPVHDTKALEQNLRRILSDHALRTRLTQTASTLLEDKFSWTAHLATLEAMFIAVTAARTPDTSE